jgi:hypothetical protein
MKTPTERSLSIQPILQALRALDLMPKIDRANRNGSLEAKTARWSVRALYVETALFAILLALAAVHYVAPLPRLGLRVALVVGLLVQLSAVVSLLLQIVSGMAFAIHRHWRIGELHRQECLLDHGNAMRLLDFDASILEATDRWIEQKIKRIERRQVRFFGGSDKLAVLVVAAMGWATWKEVGLTLATWQPTLLMFGVAFLAGLVLGGMSVARMVDGLWYQREVLQLARSLKSAADGRLASPETIAAPEARDGSAAVVAVRMPNAQVNGHQPNRVHAWNVSANAWL